MHRACGPCSPPTTAPSLQPHSLPSCPLHSCQHPPPQCQTLAANSHQGSSAKTTNHLFVQGWLGDCEHSTEHRPDTATNAEVTLPSHAPDLPLQLVLAPAGFKSRLWLAALETGRAAGCQPAAHLREAPPAPWGRTHPTRESFQESFQGVGGACA